MSKFILLAADTTNGVFETDLALYPDAEVETPDNFYNNLSTLEEEEVIFTQVMKPGTDGKYEKIDRDYGIK